MSFRIFSDSACDLPENYINQYHITRIPFYVSFDQDIYRKEIEEISIPEFYDELVKGDIYPKTSLPSVDDYMIYFRQAIEAKEGVLCLCLTSKFSGSYQSACTAKDILLEKYPDASIRIINSILATGAQGLLVLQAVKMLESGLSLNESADKLEELKNTGHVIFTLGTLEYLMKGGRIGKAAALAGNLLNLKPIIQLLDGELVPIGKVRGHKKSMDRTVESIQEFFTKSGNDYKDYDFCIFTGNNFEDAEIFSTQLFNAIDYSTSHPIFTIGTTIGTYTGPDAVGACFLKRYDS